MVTADDGFITQIIRIINPLVDRANLRKPPVLLHHGASLDVTCYLIASSKQHHPEKYPRTAADGPITSSNRSLGFVLANNGYDVFLISTRLSNQFNMGHTKDAAGVNNIPNGNNTGKNMTAGETANEYERSPFLYQTGQDDVVSHELGPQITLVLNVTGSQEFSMLSYSLSTTTTIAFLALHPDYAKRARVYMQMAPPIAATHFTAFDKLYFEDICPLLPTRGVGFTPTYIETPVVRQFIIESSANTAFKYSVIYEILVQLFGPSPLFNTNLERNSLAHIFMPVSFKTIQQYCQNSVARAFRKFDYGPVANLQIYGTPEPPTYNISRIEVQNYVIISGSTDGLADPATVNRVAATVSSPTPVRRIIGDMYNHYDLIAGTKVDEQIVLPILAEFNRVSSS